MQLTNTENEYIIASFKKGAVCVKLLKIALDLVTTRKDLEAAKRLVSEPYDIDTFEKYSSSFLFGTENQEGINDIIDYEGKDVLTTTSSGDQYVGAVYYDATKIDTFDINRITYYITCLKIAAIRELDYKEFIDFFTPLDKDGNLKRSFWNLRTLKRLLKVLPFNIAYFWDKIMYEAKKNGYKYLTVPEHCSNELLNIKSGMPFYASEEEYYKLQAKLRKREYPTFIESDVMELKEKLKSSYDIIYLSNIVECIVNLRLRNVPFVYGLENTVEREVAEKVMKQVLPFLNENGTVLVSYRSNKNLYISTDWFYNNEFFEPHLIQRKLRPDYDCWRTEDTDIVLTYMPKKSGNILK